MVSMYCSDIRYKNLRKTHFHLLLLSQLENMLWSEEMKTNCSPWCKKGKNIVFVDLAVQFKYTCSKKPFVATWLFKNE